MNGSRREHRRNEIVPLLLTLLVFPRLVLAYAELSRYGYVNCTGCHINPNGGGLLTLEGRRSAENVLSTWSADGEGRYLYGALPLPEWLNLGGDISALQSYLNTPTVEQARFLWMQTDLEAGASVSKWTFTGTLGMKNLSKSSPGEPGLLSRRHYLMYQPREELRFRAGRFLTAYGLNVPDHYIVTRRGLGFDQGAESYNVEGSWVGEQWDAFATAFFSRPDIPTAMQEKGAAARSSVVVGATSRVGLSYLYGRTNQSRRHLFGPYAIIGLGPRFFSLVEVAFQRRLPDTGRATWGIANYLRLNYQLTQGLQLYGSQEFSQLDLSSVKTVLNGYGLGIQFFPRPHFELQVFYGKRRNASLANVFADSAWFLMHYYL